MANVKFYMEDGMKEWRDGDISLGSYEFPSSFNSRDVNTWKNMFVGGAVYNGLKWYKKGIDDAVPISNTDWDMIHELVFKTYHGRRVVEVIIGLGGDGHGNFSSASMGAILEKRW